MAELTHLSLFSGIGGLDLAAEWAGFKTVGQCEWADYPRKVLEKHWPEMLRFIQEIRPTWVVGENVAGIVSMALDTVLSDLESIGYTCQAFVIPAAGVDAPHRRYRVAIVANANSERRYQQLPATVTDRERIAGGSCDEGYVSNADGPLQSVPMRTRGGWPGFGNIGWWPAEPSVGRVAHGVPSRVDRLKCLGNAVVPQQFYPIFRAIAEVEANYG